MARFYLLFSAAGLFLVALSYGIAPKAVLPKALEITVDGTDLTHIFRAIIEGISFGSELILETMRTTGFEPRDVVIAGGATRSDLWLRLHADISGLPLSLTKVADAPALGSAILAAVGAGLYDDIPSASDAMVQVVRTIEPDPEAHAAYRPIYQTYKDTYPALAELLHRQAGVT